MTIDLPPYSKTNPSSTLVFVSSTKFPKEVFCLWQSKTWLREPWLWTLHETADGVKKPKTALTTDFSIDSYATFALNCEENYSFEGLNLKLTTLFWIDCKDIDFVRCVKILTVLDIHSCYRSRVLPRTNHTSLHKKRPNSVLWKSQLEVSTTWWTVWLKNCQFFTLHHSLDTLRFPEKKTIYISLDSRINITS